jgi:hypothetical protein
MKTTIFYRKEGKKYIAVSEYDPVLVDSLPYGAHVQVVRENGMSRRYNVDPALAPMVAASMVLEYRLATIIDRASSFELDQSNKVPLTLEQKEAWENLNKSFGGQITPLYGRSRQDIARSVLEEIAAEAQKLLTNDALREQYEYFLTLSKLTKDD